MANRTRNTRTLLAAVTGLGLLCGAAFAAALQPSNAAGALTFNPFSPTRTTTAGSIATVPLPGSTSSTLLTLSGGDGGTLPLVDGGIKPTTRPPTRDPFRPPTRSPFIP